MTTIHKLGFIAALAAISTVSLAAPNCNHLISIGSQKSVIPAAKKVSLSDVNICLAQCDTLYNTGHPQADLQSAGQCRQSLTTLQLAAGFNDSMSALDPNKFTSGSSFPPTPNPAGLENTWGQQQTTPVPAAPSTPEFTQPKVAAAPVAAPAPATPTTPKTTQKKSSGISWF